MWSWSFMRKLVSFICHEVGDGSEEDSFFGAGGLGESWNRLEIFGPDFFVDEDHVHGRAGPRCLRVDQHIYTGDVTIAKSKLLRSFGDLFELRAVNRDVDVLGRSSASGSPHRDLKENR